MPDEVRLAGSVVLAIVAALAFTPLAIAVARRSGFLDRPKGYKGHARPTPYLGGAAVMLAFLLAAFAFGGAGERFEVITLLAFGVFVVGTIDDRVGLGPGSRVLAEVVAASLLWTLGVGWEIFPSDLANLLLTAVWVIGIVNAFNLMDNMDGAAGSVATVSATGTALVALLLGDVVLAALLLSLAGACAGFLRYNLAGPSRIFLGDGGSMPIGFILAAALMALPADEGFAWVALLAAAPIVGLPILDTTLVTISRRRRGAPVLSGARDHLTHRLRSRLSSPRAVALALAVVQAGLCAVGVALSQAGSTAVIATTALYLSAGLLVIYALELRWPSPASAEPLLSPAVLPEESSA